MSLLTQASICITPNGYKEGKLYSVIPSDGSGDMSVTRATTATRVNSAGLVELVPYNLLTYSEQFDNADWGKEFTTITANNITAPNGTATADRLNLGSGTEQKFIYQAKSQNGTYTQSVYLKKGTHTFFQLAVGGDVNPYCNFDLTNGTYSAFGSTATITNVGDGWYRCTMTYTTTTGTYVYIFAVDSLSSARTASTSSTGNYYAWGAQLVEGSTAKDYQKTETRLNIPRLDYSNGTCPSILVEPQRTNLVTWSSSFDNAAWIKVPLGGTALTTVVTANDTISPSGIQDADKIFMSLGGGTTTSDWARLQSQTFNQTSGTSYTISFWAWASQSSEVGKIVRVGIGNNTALLDFTLTATATRFIVTYTAAATGTDSLLFQLRGAQGLASTAEFYLWGAQLEVGSYATSYIPTTSASVTRNADVISKTGISSLIGQTEGTIFIDLDFDNLASQTNNPVLFSLLGNATIYMQMFTSGYGELIYSTGAGTQAYLYWPSVTNGHHKIAFGYKANDFVLYIDGVQVATDTSGSVDTLSSFYFAYINSAFNPTANYKAAALWKTRLTNDQLEQLTGIGFNTYAEMANYYNYTLQ